MLGFSECSFIRSQTERQALHPGGKSGRKFPFNSRGCCDHNECSWRMEDHIAVRAGRPCRNSYFFMQTFGTLYNKSKCNKKLIGAEITTVRLGVVELQMTRETTPSWHYRWRSGLRCWCRSCGSEGSPWSWRVWKCCRFPMTSDRSGTESGNTCRTERQMHRGAVRSEKTRNSQMSGTQWHSVPCESFSSV